jgi:hypothetical protein
MEKKMSKLEELISLAKFGLVIDINPHRQCYESVKKYMSDYEKNELLDKMIETDTIIEIIAYVNNASIFFTVFHHDINAAIERIIELIKNDQK